MVERVCGTPKDRVLHIWEMIALDGDADRAMTIMYAPAGPSIRSVRQMIRTGCDGAAAVSATSECPAAA